MKAVKERLVRLIEGNWKEKAEALLNERKMAAAKGKGRIKVSLFIFRAFTHISHLRCSSFSSSDTLIVT